MTDEGYWTELIRPLFVGRRVIVTGGPVAGLVETARLVRSLGAQRPFILGSEGVGTGLLPGPDEAEWLGLDAPSAPSMMDAIRASNRLLGDLPREAREALDRYDPDRSAMVVGSFFNELPEVADRRCLAFRRPAWVALEDKVVIDALWDRAGVTRAPAEIVPVEREALFDAARRLDTGRGTVWVGDARGGYHGGAEYARWVRSAADGEAAFSFLADRCDRARVMPFLDGIPCGVHGIVFDDDVAVFRPIEMVTLRRPDAPELFYAGVASYWDPEPADRDAMRTAARRVGDALRDEVGFRGPFTIDGVMTVDGFRPTELNARSGAGLQTLSRGLPGLPIQLVHAAITAGIRLDYRPRDLEALIVEHADENRGGGTWRALPASIETISNRAVVGDASGYRWASDEEPADGWVIAGPSALGGFLRLTFSAARTPKGASVAPNAVAFYQYADSQLGTEIGPLGPALPVR